MNKTYQNPILPPESADPFIIVSGGSYYYLDSTRKKITIRKAESLSSIKDAEAVVIWEAPETGEYSQNVWAPEMFFIKGRWYVYFCADDGDNVNHRMYVLEGGVNKDNPLEEPFKFIGKVSDGTDRWAIDGTIIEKDGALYIVWSGWEGNVDGKQNLYIAEMSNPWTISGERVLISEPTEAFEINAMRINEGPAVLINGDKTFIIYSGSGSWTEDYCLGMLVNTDGDLLNPNSWVKSKKAVFEKSLKNGVYGVGHCSFFKSPEGADFIAYHAMDEPSVGWHGRSCRVQGFDWNSDGMPNFNEPVPVGMELNEPF